MKRLLACVIFLSVLQAVKAAPYFVPDSGRSAMMAKEANLSPKPDTIMVPVVNNPVSLNYYQSSIYKRRLDSVKKEIPLDYNEYVQSYIDLYMSPAHRGDIARVLGLSKYYFPIYEKAFREAGIPEEIEYLSIVESELNPYAVSKVGATGLWQFMSNTARTYNLGVDSYVDERRDPIKSSYAAAAFLKDAYQEFGDWYLAIASYNCGRSHVISAIEQAGSNNFWAIRQYLPVETRGYVPAYIAINYVMNYYKHHNITPQGCTLAMNTDTVSVSKLVSLQSVSRVLHIDLAQLTVLNPSYKMLLVNGSVAAPKRLILPQAAKEKYTALYDALNADMTYNDTRVNNESYARITTGRN